MNVAIYIDSFNPFNDSNLKTIRTAIYNFDMDLVSIVPSMYKSKDDKELLDMDKRCEIIWDSLPIDIIIYSTIETIEEKLTPPYYRYATLHALKNKYHDDNVFILCEKDTFYDIQNWMNGGKIIEDFDFLIVDN